MKRPDPAVKLNALRAAHGWDGTTCPTCGRSVYSPYRRYNDRGQVLEGCIDAAHHEHLTEVSESRRWHYRKVAADIRRQELRHLQAL